MRRERRLRAQRGLRDGRRDNFRAGAFMLVTALVLAGCGTASPGTFHPEGKAASAGAGAVSGTPPSGVLAAQGVAWPPFGSDVHVLMPAYLPADSAQVPAVVAAKNFLLAFLYAEYRGNQDERWTSYATGSVVTALKANLAQPGVTTESFTGTISFSDMRAFPDPSAAGEVDVSECFNNAQSQNTSLTTGKAVPDQTPANQHYYLNTDVLARGANGQWQVVAVYPVVYYPQAKECRP